MQASPRLVAVIGGSAGALEALSSLVSRLPPDLDAALFIVMHVLPVADSRLPEILARRCALPVHHARSGDAIARGRILVAPPDHHLLLQDGHVELNRGPRENSTRPAIDPLFRSAARAFGPAACGVILSGNLDDGAEGMRRIVTAGGVGIVQDPEEAAHPEMPRNALERCGSCHVLRAAQIADALVDLSRGAPLEARCVTRDDPDDPVGRSAGPERIGADESPGTPTGLSCPECHGVLWTSSDAGDPTLHCRIGHRFTLETLQAQRRTEIESAMGAAVRALHEESSLARHIAERAERGGRQAMARRFAVRAQTAISHARVLENLLLEPMPLPKTAEPDQAGAGGGTPDPAAPRGASRRG